MHTEVARKMKMIAIPLSLIVIVGFVILVHGLIFKGWWTYFGLVLFLVPLPVLLALARIRLYSKRFER